MSADRQRLVAAIRRIATTDPEIRSLLDEAQSRGSQPASTGVGASDAESDRQCCDGSVSGNTNPGTNQRDPDSEDAGQEGGLDSADPARLDMGEGSLAGVTDCATGDDVCFDGGDWIPPEGWDSPTDPPIDPTFVEGYYATSGGSEASTVVHRTCGQAFSRYASLLSECNLSLTSGCNTENPLTGAGSTSCNPGDGSISAFYQTHSCDSDFDPVCDEPAPTLEAWPEDGCVNLAMKRGTLVGSKFDPENDGSYSSPKSEIQLCDSFGNQISLAPSADGGWKTINSTTNNGYLYDSQGNQIAHIDGNEYSDPKV